MVKGLRAAGADLGGANLPVAGPVKVQIRIPIVAMKLIHRRRRKSGKSLMGSGGHAYPRWATPFEPDAALGRLSEADLSVSSLGQFAHQQTDTEAAIPMQRARRQLLAEIAKQSA